MAPCIDAVRILHSRLNCLCLSAFLPAVRLSSWPALQDDGDWGTQAEPPRKQHLFELSYDSLAAAMAPGCCKVQAGLMPHGRAMLATEDLAVGQRILSVASRDLLCVGFDVTSRRGAAMARLALRQWQELHGALPKELARFLLAGHGVLAELTRLMAWLLWLRQHARGPWRHYMDLLPQGEDALTLPMSYSEEELHELQSPGSEAAARQQRRKFATLHIRLFSSSNGQLAELRLAPGGLDDTLWAASVAITRIFSVTVGSQSVSCLVPCADFANHAFQPNAVFLYNKTEAAFQLLASKAIKAGAEVLLSYSPAPLSNDNLFRGWGFTQPGNIHDRVQLPAAAALNAAPDGSRSTPSLSAPRLLAALGLCPPVLNSHSGLDVLAMAEAAAAAAAAGSSSSGDDEQAVEQRRLLAAVASLQPFLRGLEPGHAPSYSRGALAVAAMAAEVRREQQAAEELQQQCQLLLRSLPTSLAEDEALLAAADEAGRETGQRLSPRRRLAIVARLERKRLLCTLAGLLQRYANSLP